MNGRQQPQQQQQQQQQQLREKNCPPDTYTRLAKDFISHTSKFFSSLFRKTKSKEYKKKKKIWKIKS